MSAKIRSGDDFIILIGRDRGKVGKVIKVMACDTKKKTIVSGVNVRKKHTKPRAGSSGGILDKELAIDISNIAILDPKYKAPTRVGFQVIDGKKVRFAKFSGEVID
ncbi:50S ribosomal protein L24 [Wolbachia endosymbiont of Atemnus politus]|uniref:50S ribosomal protein L24 n=1 Tax=Wolbachia endosymbiont of Atemnus politus TaxID=2682840 RepID=UPI00157492DB|nr:50S ribosomal protein L24 [Wolbachia endosymbiont of Atemnus politus]NSM56228.1 50S ribosomal protein L24 [Wolbachia endosymbiont of Atemnus politus]NSX83469.1 50S ribosomal protein L24 [Wolbachia endosymbiont of Atemnus politus]